MYNIYVNREKKFAIQLEPTQLTRVNEQSINHISLMIYLLCESCVTHRMYVYKIGLASTVSSCHRYYRLVTGIGNNVYHVYHPCCAGSCCHGAEVRDAGDLICLQR